jgi:hypothetical protein
MKKESKSLKQKADILIKSFGKTKTFTVNDAVVVSNITNKTLLKSLEDILSGRIPRVSQDEYLEFLGQPDTKGKIYSEGLLLTITLINQLIIRSNLSLNSVQLKGFLRTQKVVNLSLEEIDIFVHLIDLL